MAPSPKGASTLALLLEYMHAELDRVGAPRDLVQMLPAPVTREQTFALMRQADLVVATGSQTNVRAAYESGTPALGVGPGNVSAIVDETADVAEAAAKIARSKTFDHATSCSSENSVIVVGAVAEALLDAFAREGGVLLDGEETQRLKKAMFPNGKLAPRVIAQAAPAIAEHAGLVRPELDDARFLIVEETGVGDCASLFRRKALAGARAVPRRGLRGGGGPRGAAARFPGRRPFGRACTRGRPERAVALGLTLPVCRVIVNQAHCFATGGSFDNALPFSLSMGCGTWGRNSLSDNLNYRHFLNITRVVTPLAPADVHEPTDDEIFGAYRRKFRA